jgi:Caspase domain
VALANFRLAAAHSWKQFWKRSLRPAVLAAAELQMIKRLVLTAAVIGGAILSMVCTPDAAWADKRVALIVGNSRYQTVPQLPNPARDANAVAQLFRDAGFDSVDLQVDVGNLEFKRAIRRFEATADEADIAVVYYAGHGLEIGATNYLIPTDARLASDRDADDEAIALERMVSSADGAKRLRLIILDACRDNPFVGTMRRERKVATRAVSGGLGQVQPTSTDTLIAYAAKAGSTADDGDGQHSPFTTAVLKNLTVPGLDVRLAFGRVRDEVLKNTGNRQEPFVYGSLGGNNVSLVPPPAVKQATPAGDEKADYDLVQQIGTPRAWQVFLGQHPTGFYADLARAQIEALSHQPQNPQQPDVKLASLPQTPAPNRDTPPTKEAIEWDKVKDSTDPATLQKFIKRFPDSPQSIIAQQRIDVLKQAAQEREDKARADAAQKKRDDDERRAREAEAVEKAKAAAAEAAAQKKRDDDERRAAAAEADRRAKAAEADRKAQDAQRKAEQAERDKAAAEAAAARAAADKQAKEADAARKTAELAAAKQATCKDEQGKLDALLAKGSDGTGVDDLKLFSRTVTCDRLGPLVVAALDRFNAEAAKRAASMPNSPELVRSVQSELIRLGCLTGTVDGTLNAPTKSALGRYLSIGGQPTDNASVTVALVAELTKHTTRVCPLECKSGETRQGDTCVADQKPAAAPAVATRKNNEEDDSKARRKQADRQPEREQRSKPAPAPEAPRARQQAVARPSIVSGGGGAHPMIGVGF